jgi:hypothetical protein
VAYSGSKLSDDRGDSMADIRAASYISNSTELYAPVPGEPNQCDDIPYGNNGAAELPGCFPRETSGPTFSQAHSIQNKCMLPLEAHPIIPSIYAEEHLQISTGGWSPTASEESHAPSTMGIPSPMTLPLVDQKEAVTARNFNHARSQKARTALSFSSFKYDKSNALNQTGASLIEELAQAVHVLDQGWMKKLGSMFPPSDIEKHFAADLPFQNGIEAWQQCFRAPDPRTLREIFSLLRIAVAATDLLHPENNSSEIFYKNVLQWSDVIADSEEKKLFLIAADILLTPPDSAKLTYLQINCQCPRWVVSPQVVPGEIEGDLKPCSGPASPGLAGHEHSSRSSPFDMQTLVIQSHRSLVQGPILTVCTRYLDCKYYLAFFCDPT